MDLPEPPRPDQKSYPPAPQPPAPPVPGSKSKPSTGFIIAMVIVGLIVLGAIISAFEGESNGGSTDVTPTGPVEISITAEDVVDAMPSGSITRFCNAYFAIADYDRALAQFKQGYTESDPSAEEVFDEVLSRC